MNLFNILKKREKEKKQSNKKNKEYKKDDVSPDTRQPISVSFNGTLTLSPSPNSSNGKKTNERDITSSDDTKPDNNKSSLKTDRLFRERLKCAAYRQFPVAFILSGNISYFEQFLDDFNDSQEHYEIDINENPDTLEPYISCTPITFVYLIDQFHNKYPSGQISIKKFRSTTDLRDINLQHESELIKFFQEKGISVFSNSNISPDITATDDFLEPKKYDKSSLVEPVVEQEFK